MKEILLQYAGYNIWANKLIADAMMKLSDAQVDMELVSSFPSIRKTVYHTWAAEYIWLQRLLLAERPVWVAADFTGTFGEACGEWQKASGELLRFAQKQFDDNSFTHMVQYYDQKKNAHKTPVFQVLQHVFNHSTYHRGQMVTMLRQAGAQEIPGTDFIAYGRKK